MRAIRAMVAVSLACFLGAAYMACSPKATHIAAITAEDSAYAAALYDCLKRAKQGDGGLAWYELCAQDVDKQYGVKK